PFPHFSAACGLGAAAREWVEVEQRQDGTPGPSASSPGSFTLGGIPLGPECHWRKESGPGAVLRDWPRRERRRMSDAVLVVAIVGVVVVAVVALVVGGRGKGGARRSRGSLDGRGGPPRPPRARRRREAAAGGSGGGRLGTVRERRGGPQSPQGERVGGEALVQASAPSRTAVPSGRGRTADKHRQVPVTFPALAVSNRGERATATRPRGGNGLHDPA